MGKLNYKSSSGMFSWIAYRIGNLECTGKRNGKIYPSEVNKNKIEKIENDIDANTNEIRQNQNDIGQLKERTDENKNEIGRVNNRTADTENEIDQLKERTDENKNEIDQLEKRIVENNNEIDGVNNRTAENENEIGQLKERTDEKEKELIAVESRTTNLEANVVEDDFYYKYGTSYTEFIEGNLLQFVSKLSGNDGGHFDPKTGQFTAPVDGRYNFRLYLHAYFSDGGRDDYFYNLSMRVNGSGKQYLGATGTPDYWYDGRYFEMDYDLRTNDKVDFYIDGATSGLQYSFSSFVEGKLSKK